MKILWLASWYPSPFAPTDGDFIQRHAKAVSEVVPLHVIHIVQRGHKVSIADDLRKVERKGNLTEHIYAFKFIPTGIDIFDKIRYNLLYHRIYRRVLKAWIGKNGKPDLLHVHEPVKAGMAALSVQAQYGIPYIVSEQSSHYEPLSPDYYFKRSKYFQKNTKRIFEQAAAVTNVSETIGERLKQIFNIRKYLTVHNLVNTDIFWFGAREAGTKIRFIHVSALGEQKNPGGMIRALATMNKTFSNWEMVICGPAKKEIFEAVEQSGLRSKVTFTGEVTYEKVAENMRSADVFVLFSNHENFPCVVVEALCCGLPVVSSKAGGVAEAVNESNGMLVDIGDETALAEAMQKIAINFAEYDRGKIAREAAQQFNRHIIAMKFVSLYNEILPIGGN